MFTIIHIYSKIICFTNVIMFITIHIYNEIIFFRKTTKYPYILLEFTQMPPKERKGRLSTIKLLKYDITVREGLRLEQVHLKDSINSGALGRRKPQECFGALPFYLSFVPVFSLFP